MRPVPDAGTSILPVVVSAYFGGVICGLVGALILFFSLDIPFSMSRHFLDPGHPGRFSIWILAAAVVITGLLRARARKSALLRDQDARTRTEATAVQLAGLRATLDDLDYGIVVLDQERRAQFINRAFRRIWRVPDDVAESKPTFVKLMYHGRGRTAYAVSPDRLGDYVAGQMTLIRTGEERPIDIRLANGEVLQFRCKALPGGGRLLTYGNVSDLVHHAEILERLAAVDGMTGLYNRRQFLALAEKEWTRSRRYGRPLALLMIDIDLFKSVNDRFGHHTGDEVIKAVAGILANCKRASDIVGRMGGEEFALVLPEATLDNACVAAERLKQLVAEHVITVEGCPVPITISIGASFAQADTSGVEELMKQADFALYEAKRSGRNRVCRFEPRKPSDSHDAEPPSLLVSAQ
jgi:diguanylate cyclase (GGDEF)-like protein